MTNAEIAKKLLETGWKETPATSTYPGRRFEGSDDSGSAVIVLSVDDGEEYYKDTLMVQTRVGRVETCQSFSARDIQLDSAKLCTRGWTLTILLNHDSVFSPSI